MLGGIGPIWASKHSFPRRTAGELGVNELGDDVGAETRGGSSWLWRIDMANEGLRGGGEVGDDGGRQPGGTDGVFPVAPLVRLRTREMMSVSLMRSLNRCWS